MTLKYLQVLLYILFLTGCSSSNYLDPITIEYIIISEGDLFGDGAEGIAEQNTVINTDNVWNDLVDQMNTVNNVSGEFQGVPIDFNESTVIAVFDDIKPNGGYDLELSIYSLEDSIEINVINAVPGGNATTVITQPYIIVKIPKTDLPIHFY